jgi:predicted nuclease of predicted toxin-antitoxin system
VKFLVDAQLPVRLAYFLNRAGHEAIHTSDLPNGNASTDAQVVETADAEGRVVIMKDRDFRDGHLLSGSPRKLFIVATGNISNDALMTRGPSWCRYQRARGGRLGRAASRVPSGPSAL